MTFSSKRTPTYIHIFYTLLCIFLFFIRNVLMHTGLQATRVYVNSCFQQDEFLDVIYWIRQIIAIILGVIWGVAPLKGFLGIAM